MNQSQKVNICQTYMRNHKTEFHTVYSEIVIYTHPVLVALDKNVFIQTRN